MNFVYCIFYLQSTTNFFGSRLTSRYESDFHTRMAVVYTGCRGWGGGYRRIWGVMCYSGEINTEVPSGLGVPSILEGMGVGAV